MTVQTEQVAQSVQSGPPNTGASPGSLIALRPLASLAAGVVVHGGDGGGVGQTYFVVVTTFVTLPLLPLPDSPLAPDPWEPDPFEPDPLEPDSFDPDPFEPEP